MISAAAILTLAGLSIKHEEVATDEPIAFGA
jgi:hypothetical protein